MNNNKALPIYLDNIATEINIDTFYNKILLHENDTHSDELNFDIKLGIAPSSDDANLIKYIIKNKLTEKINSLSTDIISLPSKTIYLTCHQDSQKLCRTFTGTVKYNIIECPEYAYYSELRNYYDNHKRYKFQEPTKTNNLMTIYRKYMAEKSDQDMSFELYAELYL